VYDTGSVWINVNGFQVSVPYGQGSTANSIASALSSALNSTGSPVIASANGSVVTVTASQAGYNTNSYTLSSGSTSNQPNSFSPPSFSSARSGSTLAGGADAAGPSLATPAVTLYLYDAMNNLTKVVQGSQTRTFVLDGLSRRTSVTTPEAGTDTFTYTTSGGALCAADASALCQSQDARGVVTIYSYDALNRLIGKSFSVPQNSGVAAMPNVCTPIGSTTSQNVCFNYDQGGSSAFALGRETQMVDPSGSETYTYNQMGWVTAMQKTIGSQTFLTSYQYNAGGAVTKITYPSGHAVQYSLDAIGQISGVSRDGTNYATGIVYNASGQFTTFNYGNGVAANFSYSPTRSQLTGLSYSHGNQTYLNLNYLYSQDLTNCPGGPAGNNGQISCVIDIGQPGRTVNYTYDAVRRLSTAFTNGDSANFLKWGLSWTYDQYGNRLSQNQTAGSPPYNNLSFGNTNGLTGAFTNRPDGFPFDASGNMLSDGHNTLTYDAENRVVSSVNQISGATGVYSYDGNGKRVQKLTGAIPTVYIFSGHGIAEYDNGAGPASPSREYIFAGGSLIATVNGSTTTFHHADHLSVRLNTDGTPGSPTNGQVVGEQGTYPFGESWYASNTTTKLFFTTYERDSESQNDFAMARYYISRLGRFSCVDPKMGTPSDPQSWNRYAYVRNDPIDLTDPSGMSWWLKLLEFLIKWLLNFLTGGGGFFLHFPGPQINIPFSTPPTFSSGPGLDWQTVVFGPPDPSKMIINNWSPDAHDILVQLALGPCGVSPLDISLIQAGSRDVDKRHALDPKYANAHYMAMRGQSADAAIAGANAWTSWYEQDAQDAWNDKDYDDAMFTLGQSIHPVMDSTSPMHVNLKTGKPKTWPTAGNAPFHSPFEGLGFEDITMIPPVRQSYPKAFEAMNQAIRDAYEFVTGRHLICGGAK
jgi:RHS repeat-associated protein